MEIFIVPQKLPVLRIRNINHWSS